MSNSLSVRLRGAPFVLYGLLLALGVACSGGGGGGSSGGGGSGGGGGGGSGSGGGTGGSTPLVIPLQGDWVNRGSTGIQASGVLNQWNYRIDGAISPCAVIKRNGTYYLYYIAADGNRASDGGPRHRALGVATSTDGEHFTNSASNPIVTHTPNNNDEEGVFSCTAVVDDGGGTVLYYGGMTETSSGSTSVSADGYRLTAANSINFGAGPGTKVLNRLNNNIFNFGDELYPIGVFRSGSMFQLYYTSQGNVENWALGLASGSSAGFTSTQGLITPANASQEIIGGGAVVYDTPSSFLLFTLRSFADRVLEVREVPTSNPADIGNPIRSYTGFPNVQHFTVLLDEDDGNWFLYIAELSFIRVYTAPVQRM